MSTVSSAESRRPFAAIWPPPREGWLALACVALIYAAHWLYGALVNDTAFAVGFCAALLVGAVLATPRLRDDLLRLKTLRGPAIAFGLALAVGVWTLTPWTPGGPHPVWAYVGLPHPASTIDKSSTLAELIKLMGLGCLFLLGAAIGGHDGRARYAIRATVAAGLVFAIWAFIGAVSGSLPTYEPGSHRLEANFLNGNSAGTLFAMLVLLALSEAFSARGGSGRARLSSRAPAMIAALVLLLCQIATLSRGALAALAAGGVSFIVLLLVAGRIRASRAVVVGIAALLVMATFIAVGSGSIIDRLALAGYDSAVRTEVWRAHWQSFLDSPLFGYGLGTSETVNKTLITKDNFPYLVIVRGLMNVYLQWLEQAGVLGAAPMFAAIGLVLWTTFRGALRRNRMRVTLCALLAVDVVVLAHGVTDFGLEVFSIAATWAWLLGLQFGLAQGSSTR